MQGTQGFGPSAAADLVDYKQGAGMEVEQQRMQASDHMRCRSLQVED